MNYRDLFALDDACCMCLFHSRPDDIVMSKYLADAMTQECGLACRNISWR